MDAVRAMLDQTPIDFYYTMTNFQCPSNVCWSERKRRQLLALAQENSFTIVEDDCLGDLTFDGRPRQTLRGLDDGDTVLYLNSFSKSLVPGLRLGYLLVPGRFEKRLILAKFNADIASSALQQKCWRCVFSVGCMQRIWSGWSRSMRASAAAWRRRS